MELPMLLIHIEVVGAERERWNDLCVCYIAVTEGRYFTANLHQIPWWPTSVDHAFRIHIIQIFLGEYCFPECVLTKAFLISIHLNDTNRVLIQLILHMARVAIQARAVS